MGRSRGTADRPGRDVAQRAPRAARPTGGVRVGKRRPPERDKPYAAPLRFPNMGSSAAKPGAAVAGIAAPAADARVLLDAAGWPMAVLTPDLRVQLANEAMARLVEVPREQLEGSVATDVAPGLDVAAEVARALMSGSERGAVSITRADGTSRDIEWQARRIEWDGGGALVVTARDTAEERLRGRAEAVEAQVRDSTSDGLLLYDAEGVLMTANRAAQTMLGVGEAVLLGTRAADPPWSTERQDGRLLVASELPVTRSLLEGEVVDRERLHVLRRDGSNVFLEFSSRPLEDAGERRGAVVTLQAVKDADGGAEESGAAVTALRESAIQIRLRTSEARFTALFDALPTAAAVVDRSGRLIAANQAMARLTGRPLGDLIGVHFAELMAADQSTAARADFERLLRTGIGFTSQRRFVRPDGEVRHALGVLEGIAGMDGEVDEVCVSILDVTELSNVQSELRASESRFRALFDRLPAGAVVMEPGGHFTEANEAMARLTGRPLAELIGMHFRSIFAPHDADAAEADFQGLLRTGEGSTARRVLRLPDGTDRQVLTVLEGITRDDGAVVEVSASVLDVTRLERTQTALQASEGRWSTLAELTNEAIVVSEGGLIKDVNPAFERLTGTSRSDLLDHHIADVLAPEGLDAVHRARVDAGEVGAWLTSIRTASGEVIRVEAEARMVELAGQRLRVSVLRDLSEREEAERQLELLGTALQQAEESVVITDAAGTIQFVNPAFERVTGYSAQQARGQNPRLLKSGKHPASFYRAMWATLTRGEVWHGRLYNRRADGELYHEEATITPIQNDDGQITHYLGLKRNISREVELQEQLRQSQKLEALGQLAGGVAHDFNNLLSIMMGNAELLMLDADEEAEAEELREIIEAGSRAAAITRQLLLFSRSQPDADVTLVDVNQLLLDSAKLYRRLLDERVELVHEFHPGLPQVRIDPTHLSQVIMNMTVNARDAMPDGGHLTYRTRVAIATENEHPDLEPGPHVVLEISDDGEGMDDQTAAKVFEPFFTTKTEGKGTGLGLATCYGIARQRGGTITVQSELGRGTTFRVWLPEATGVERTASLGASRRTLVRGFGHVLLVEDNAALRNVAAMALRKAGYEVTTCVDGLEAMQLLQEGDRIDALVSDLIMPRKSGMELAQFVRVHMGEGVPVLLMSGYAESVTAKDIESVGASFMGKPFTMYELTERLAELFAEQA